MPFHPSLRSLLLADRFHRETDAYRSAREVKAAARARAHEAIARHNCAPFASIDVEPADRPTEGDK